MAKPTPESLPTLLVTELWGLGDLALAIPFLRTAVQHARVSLVAKPHAAPLLRRFAPEVNLVPLDAPWTAFTGKYRLHHWPWADLWETLATLRQHSFDLGVSARPDPRDHLLLALAGVTQRIGYARTGSGLLLTRHLDRPSTPHRAAYWTAIAAELGWSPPAQTVSGTGPMRRIVIHTGAGQPTRRWPVERFRAIASHLSTLGCEVIMVDDSLGTVDELLNVLASADGFIGNDSGPGHLAALLGVPTFTVFGPQLPGLFAPQHPQSAWIEGSPCLHKPCLDRCRFTQPRCILGLETKSVLTHLTVWLKQFK